MKPHLSHTGFHAGKLLCGRARNGSTKSEHASYSKVDSDPGRYCPQCAAVWLAYAYQGEPLPGFPVTPEMVAEFEAEFPADCVPMQRDDPAFLEFSRKLRALTP